MSDSVVMAGMVDLSAVPERWRNTKVLSIREITSFSPALRVFLSQEGFKKAGDLGVFFLVEGRKGFEKMGLCRSRVSQIEKFLKTNDLPITK